LKRFTIALTAALLLAPGAFASTWITSLPAAQKKSKETKQLIFVDLFADWCGWCKRMEAEVFPSQAFQSATDKMVLLRLNTEDGADGSKISQQFSVTSLPTFLILTPDNMIAAMIRGYAPSKEFVDSMKESLAKYNDFQTRVAHESTIAGDYQKRLDLAREFTSRFGLKDSESRFRKLIGERAAPADVRDQAYYELAVSLLLQNRLDDATKALVAFGKTETKGEAYERSRILLAQVYMQQGNFLGAANELRTFKAQFPSSPLIRNVELMLPSVERQLQQKR